jgi:hypothetical protein
MSIKYEIPSYEKYKENKYIKTVVHIDSSDRVKTNLENIDRTISILSMKFIENSFDIECKTIMDHNLILDDQLRFNDMVWQNIQLENPLELFEDSKYIKINHTNHLFDDTYLDEDLYVTLSGVIGNNVDNTLINNIPINMINDTHKIHLLKNNNNQVDPNFYFILVDIESNGSLSQSTSEYYKLSNSVNIKIENISNIPLSTFDETFDVIEIYDKNTFTIRLDTKIIKEIILNNMIADKVTKNREFFSSPTRYDFRLERKFRNVASVKMLSSEIRFPNKNVDDSIMKAITIYGNTYEINIGEGKYNIDTLMEYIKDSFDEIGLITNYMLNKNTDKLTLGFSNIIQLPSNPLNKVNETTISFTLENNNLEIGDQITLRNSLDLDIFPSDVINSTHTITNINKDIIFFKIERFNKLTTLTGIGGNTIDVEIPAKTTLILDDNLKEYLGFNSLSKNYSYLHTNDSKFKFIEHNFLLMTIPQIQSKPFAKMLYKKRRLTNAFVNLTNELTKLLVFDNLTIIIDNADENSENSFTLEIIEKNDM